MRTRYTALFCKQAECSRTSRLPVPVTVRRCPRCRCRRCRRRSRLLGCHQHDRDGPRALRGEAGIRVCRRACMAVAAASACAPTAYRWGWIGTMSALPLCDRVGNALVDFRCATEAALVTLAPLPLSLIVVTRADTVLMMLIAQRGHWELPGGTREREVRPLDRPQCGSWRKRQASGQRIWTVPRLSSSICGSRLAGSVRRCTGPSCSSCRGWS